MRHNRYDGLLDRWKVRLMAKRASRLGFRPHEIDDAMQELVLDVMAFRYDPAKSNGASEATALTAVIDNRLRTIRRGWRRYQRHVEALRAKLGGDEVRDRWPEPVEDETALLVLDVREALALLSARERRLCRALLAGQTLAEVARRRGCDWHVRARVLAHVCRRFQALGLEGWLA
jgi:DNA-directed RNA polymerase specialized sigma24 family protein